MLSPKSAQILSYLASATTAVFLTAEDGNELAQALYISVDATSVDPTNPSAFKVSLTDAGMQAALAPKQNPYVVTDAIPLPKQRSSKPKAEKAEKRFVYPFDTMEVGQSFHVGVSVDNAEPWKTMASNVSAATRKFMIESVPQEMVTVTRQRLVKVDGKPVLDANGKKVYEEYTSTEPKMIETKKFIARRVNETDPSGVGARVWRTA